MLLRVQHLVNRTRTRSSGTAQEPRAQRRGDAARDVRTSSAVQVFVLAGFRIRIANQRIGRYRLGDGSEEDAQL